MADRRFFYLLNRAQHTALKFADQHLLQQLGITSSQLGALFYLRKNDGCLLKDLSQGLGLNNSAITGLVNRMEAQSLVARRPCDRDGRAFRLYMTERGKERVEAGFPLLHELNRLLAEEFSDEELEVVARFLEAIIERLGKPSSKPPLMKGETR